MNFNGGSGFGGSGSLGPTVIDGDLTVNDRILMSDGSVAAPSLAYTAEPTTGWTRTASGEARFVVSGASKVVLNSSGVTAPNGTFSVSLTTPTASVGTITATTATLSTATIPNLTSASATFTSATTTTFVATTQPLVKRSVLFTLPSNTQTAVDFTTAGSTRGTGISWTSGSNQFTVAAAGYYSVDATAQFDTTTGPGGDYVSLELRANGVSESVEIVPVNISTATMISIHFKDYLAANSVINALVRNSTGGAHDCYCTITVIKDS